MLTPGEIREQEFKTAFRGYDPREVENFLDFIADEVERIIEENNKLKQNAQRLEDELNDFYAKEETLSNALLSSQEFIDKMTKDARKKAEETISSAQAKAQKKVQKELGELDKIKKQREVLQQENQQFMQRLRYIINEHLDLLTKIEQENRATNLMDETVSTPPNNQHIP